MKTILGVSFDSHSYQVFDSGMVQMTVRIASQLQVEYLDFLKELAEKLDSEQLWKHNCGIDIRLYALYKAELSSKKSEQPQISASILDFNGIIDLIDGDLIQDF